MLSILGLLLPIGGELAKAYAARQNAVTDQQRIAADARVKELEAARDVQVAEAGNKINAMVRAFIALPFAIFFWKVIVIDKVLGWGSTDDLSPNFWTVSMVVVGFYFLHSIIRG